MLTAFFERSTLIKGSENPQEKNAVILLDIYEIANNHRVIIDTSANKFKTMRMSFYNNHEFRFLTVIWMYVIYLLFPLSVKLFMSFLGFILGYQVFLKFNDSNIASQRLGVFHIPNFGTCDETICRKKIKPWHYSLFFLFMISLSGVESYFLPGFFFGVFAYSIQAMDWLE